MLKYKSKGLAVLLEILASGNKKLAYAFNLNYKSRLAINRSIVLSKLEKDYIEKHGVETFEDIKAKSSAVQTLANAYNYMHQHKIYDKAFTANISINRDMFTPSQSDQLLQSTADFIYDMSAHSPILTEVNKLIELWGTENPRYNNYSSKNKFAEFYRAVVTQEGVLAEDLKKTTLGSRIMDAMLGLLNWVLGRNHQTAMDVFTQAIDQLHESMAQTQNIKAYKDNAFGVDYEPIDELITAISGGFLRDRTVSDMITDKVPVNLINEHVSKTYARDIDLGTLTRLPEGLDLRKFNIIRLGSLREFPVDIEFPLTGSTIYLPQFNQAEIPRNILNQMENNDLRTKDRKYAEGEAGEIISQTKSQILTGVKSKYGFEHEANYYPNRTQAFHYTLGVPGKPVTVEFNAGTDLFPADYYKAFNYHGVKGTSPLGWFGGVISKTTDLPSDKFVEVNASNFVLGEDNYIMEYTTPEWDEDLGDYTPLKNGNVISHDAYAEALEEYKKIHNNANKDVAINPNDKTFTITEVQSDPLQRTHELKEGKSLRGLNISHLTPLKSKIENHFDGWMYVFAGTGIYTVLKNNPDITQIRIPTSEYYETKHPSAPVQIYDKIGSMFKHTKSKDGKWYIINVADMAAVVPDSMKDQYDVIIKAAISAGVKDQKEATPDLASDRELASDVFDELLKHDIFKKYFNSDAGQKHLEDLSNWMDQYYSITKPESGNTEGGEEILVGPEGEEIPGDYAETPLDKLVKESLTKDEIPLDIDWALDELNEAIKNKNIPRANFIKQLLGEQHGKSGIVSYYREPDPLTKIFIRYNATQTGFFNGKIDHIKLQSELRNAGFTDLKVVGSTTKGYKVVKPNNKMVNPFKISFHRETSSDLESETPGEWEMLDPAIANEPVTLDTNEINKTRAIEIATKLADRLAQQLGVNYEVITEQEAERITKNAASPWNGEAAFYIGNTVYFIGNKLTTDIVLHEFGHPLVRAISNENPELFEALYQKVLSTSEGSSIVAHVTKEYADQFSPGDKLFKEEVIVFALALAARNHIGNVPQSKGFLAAIKDILYQIKRMLRRVFGKGIKVENLDVNTSLDELGNMLASKDFQINNDKVTDEDVVAYIREQSEQVETLKKLKDEQLQNWTDRLAFGVNKHVKELEDNKDYLGMLNILKDQFGSNELKEIKGNLNKFKTTLTKDLEELRKDFNYVNEHVSNMASSLYRLSNIAKLMIKELERISTETPTPELIARVNYYNEVIDYYKNFTAEGIEDLRKGGIPTDNKLFAMLSAIKADLEGADNIVKGVYKKGTRDIMLHTLDTTIKNVDKDFEDLIASLIKRGAPKKVIDSHRARYEAVRLTPEKIEKILNGELGDMNTFQAYFGGFASSADPIVAGFGLYVKKHMMDVETAFQKKQNDFLRDVFPLLKEAGIGLDDVNELSKLVSFVDKARGKDEKGNYILKEVRTLLNGFKDYRYELGRMEDEIQTAALEAQQTQDFTKVSELKAAYAKHLRDYFHQDNIPEFYESDAIFKTEIGMEAKEERDAALFKIKDLNNITENEWDELEIAPQLDQAWKEYRQLFSIMDLNGNRKSGRELEKVNILKLYREISQGFYEMKPIEGRFQNALASFEQQMIDKKIPRDSQQFKTKRAEWIKRNTRTVIKPEFYITRRKIFDEVTTIMAKLPKDVQAQIDITKAYEDINEAIYGFRDQDGQPEGTAMSAGRVELVKKSQEEINAAREKFAGLSGLTQAEMEELTGLVQLGKGNRSQEERDRMTELFAKKDSLGINKIDKARLTRLWAQLSELQHKEATEYYVDIFNNYLSKLDTDNFFADNGSRIITKDSADFALNNGTIQDLMDKSPEFKTWFEKNHIKKKFYNMETHQKEEKWERLYIWNVVRPNDEDYLEKTPIKDESGKVIEEIIGVPTFKFFSREIKPEFKTARIVGKTVDNLNLKGNFLPKTLAQGAPDNRYINQAYFDLANNNPKAFEVLEMLKKHHLKIQSDFAPESRLYLDIPRYETETLELAQRSDNVERAKNSITAWFDKVKNYFRHSANDQEEDMNYNTEQNIATQFHIVQSDIYSNEKTKVPITGLSNFNIDQVSQDIPRSMMRYALSGERQKKLIEINPVSKALKNVLTSEGLKDMDKQGKFATLTRAILPFKKKKGQSVRSATIDAYYAREFHGEQNTGWTKDMKGVDATVKLMSKSASFGFFALNIPSALKNAFSAMIQNMIEAVAGKHINTTTYHQGMAWSGLASMDISMELYKHKTKGLRVQLIEIFDPSSGRFQDQAGQGLSRTMFRDAVSMSWLYSPRKWTELNATLGLFGGMMYHKKITKLDGTEISYIDAWEVVDGQIQLKAGIDPKYGVGGSEFQTFRSQIQEVNNNLNGAFSQFDAPLVGRYMAYRMIAFMRRYFPSMAANRFGSERLNAARGEMTRGYYLDAIQAFGKMLLSGGMHLQWMSPNEKRAFLRVFAEVGNILIINFLLSLLGWDPDDKERYEKMRAKSGTPGFLPGVKEDPEHPFVLSGWLANHATNLLINIRAESIQWLPVPGLGLKDYQQSLDWNSVMFGPTISSYTKMLDDLVHIGSESGYYKKSVGPYEWQQKDSFKFWNHLARTMGITGSTMDPVTNLQNLISMRARK